MTVPTRITDHTAAGVGGLTERFRKHASNRAWLASYLDQVQALEDLLWEIIDTRVLENCEGAQLDLWGKFLRQPRVYGDDDQYRLVLLARMLILRSNGTAPNLIALLQTLLDADVQARVFERGPRQIRIFIDSIVEDHGELIALLLRQARAIAKQLRVIYSPTALSNRFTLKYTGATNDPAKGLGMATIERTFLADVGYGFAPTAVVDVGEIYWPGSPQPPAGTQVTITSPSGLNDGVYTAQGTDGGFSGWVLFEETFPVEETADYTLSYSLSMPTGKLASVTDGQS